MLTSTIAANPTTVQVAACHCRRTIHHTQMTAMAGRTHSEAAIDKALIGLSSQRHATTAKNVTIRLTLPRLRSDRNSELTTDTASDASLMRRGTGMSAHVATSRPRRRKSQARLAPSGPTQVRGTTRSAATGVYRYSPAGPGRNGVVSVSA